MKDGDESLDLVWGAEAIGRVISRTPRQVFAMLETGQLPAKKVGGRWVADRKQLAAFFLSEVGEAA